ncbi:hypothetical protein ACVR1I_01685 [Streptococcus cameli]
MIQKQTRFPLVGDDEPIVGHIPQMNLYDESDLISNIKGPYQEKAVYESIPVAASSQTDQSRPSVTPNDLLPPLFHAEPSRFSRKDRLQKASRSNETASHQGKTQGQLAREKAREDLKKKRSAAYLKDDKPIQSRMTKPVNQVSKPVPTQQPEVSPLHQLANRLRQEQYILADMPVTYPLEKEERQKESVVKKNSYDFLKKSQVYNYPERKRNKERQLAQELNLTHMEEE